MALPDDQGLGNALAGEESCPIRYSIVLYSILLKTHRVSDTHDRSDDVETRRARHRHVCKKQQGVVAR